MLKIRSSPLKLRLKICTFFSRKLRFEITMYNVQCTMYNVQCTMYKVQCTMYNVQCTMYDVQCTMYNVQAQCTMTMYNVK